jgi:hypothetical protein
MYDTTITALRIPMLRIQTKKIFRIQIVWKIQIQTQGLMMRWEKTAGKKSKNLKIVIFSLG